MKLPDEYTVEPYSIYWVKKDGEFHQLLNMRELKKLYKDKKDVYKKYLKLNRVKYQDQESMIQFIEYLETN